MYIKIFVVLLFADLVGTDRVPAHCSVSAKNELCIKYSNRRLAKCLSDNLNMIFKPELDRIFFKIRPSKVFNSTVVWAIG